MIFPNPAENDLFDRDTIVEDAQTDHASAEVN
jgi:arginine deiminase